MSKPVFKYVFTVSKQYKSVDFKETESFSFIIVLDTYDTYTAEAKLDKLIKNSASYTVSSYNFKYDLREVEEIS